MLGQSMRNMSLIILMIAGSIATAMPVKSTMIKPKAIEDLDLKSKTLFLGKADFDLCGAKMARRGQTLAFSCTLPIPVTAKVSELQKLVSASSKDINFGSTKRTVLFQVSPDARQLTLSTAFDATGVDFDITKFNDDLSAVYAKVAHMIIVNAMKDQPVRLEVLESRL